MLDFPENWIVGRNIQIWIDDSLDWVVINWDPFFSAINIGVLRFLGSIEAFLLLLPWWLVVLAITLTSWRMIGRWGCVFAATGMMIMGFLGLHDLAMMTLAIVVVATVLCIGMGLPLGILSAKNDRIDRALRPILDAMQTMPSFVYLIPAVMVFSIGKTPAVMATFIYAIPPMIRLTNLGIRQVDPDVVEAARAFGCTPVQLLTKVQLPMGLPTIMAGVNQTIMMALAMVIIASYIGARGLGVEILNGIARLEVGRGLLAGLGIVFLAIIIDRISQGFAKPRGVRAT